MLAPDTRLQPNAAEVAAKVIDGEAIIMNLANGLYFSMDNVGAAIWEFIEAGQSLEIMGRTLSDRYGVDQETAMSDVSRLAGELLEENLVLMAPENLPVPPMPNGVGSEGQYSSPVLNKYSDMADLLALDPPMPDLGAPPLD
ncbi:MAG: PqqD family protein [Gemmatimonadota bacterium]|jgi:hypothetical protein